ncbi:flavin reductase [Streptomyces sp. NPDC005708]|uniref:flavin reductase n=1 Tax=Streptomyces sp. NPDC005708 TaxID=3154564 RepID=UPI0033C4F9D3
MTTTDSTTAVDPRWFRQVLGTYPTGVCVISAIHPDGAPVGMAVGSFTSVSLDPPLVAFLPDHSSTSWPKIRAAGRFCVNILGADQEHVCRAFASKAPNKFAGLGWRPGPSGLPVLDGVVAWIECDLDAVHTAGDHDIVIGRVTQMSLGNPTMPLVFFEGGYGRFEPSSRAAADADLFDVLRNVDPGRPEMERIAREMSVECVAGAIVGDEIVHVASAGTPPGGQPAVRVGMRSPLAPPLGMSWLPWAAETDVRRWLARAPTPLSPGQAEAWRAALDRVRKRGFWIRLGGPSQPEFDARIKRLSTIADVRWRRSVFHDLFDPEPTVEYGQPELSPDTVYEVRAMSAPVFDQGGRARYALILFGFPPRMSGAEIAHCARRLRAACDAAGNGLRPLP